MKDLAEEYLVFSDGSEDENEIDLEEEHPLILEIQGKYNELNERYISLKTIADTLKSQIEQEKELWRQELKETMKMENQIKQQQKKHYEMIMPNEMEIRRKFEIFRDFLFFTKATENIETMARKNNYEQWLTEVESECSLELDRIQKSLTALRPLREMVSKWNNGDFSCDSGADGDKGTEEHYKETEKSLYVIKKNDNFKFESENEL